MDLQRLGIIAAIASMAFSNGCVLAPKEIAAERERLASTGVSYESRVEDREIPNLPDRPAWRDMVQHAFLANGDLESAYFEWKAAVERVNIAAGYPNTNISVGYSYMFSAGNMKAWDRSTLNVGFDSMQNLSFPTKVAAAGRVSFDEAQAAGKRFAALKFDLQRRVLVAWNEFALAAEQVRILREQLALLALSSDIAGARVRGGLGQGEILQTHLNHDTLQNELTAKEALLPQIRARLNGMIGRAVDAPLQAPSLPEPRIADLEDAALLSVAVDNNPELAALAHEVQGRSDTIDVANQQYIPDVNPFAGFTGSISQMVGATVTFATTIPQLRAAVRDAESMHRAMESRLRQRTSERHADFLATLAALRNEERIAAFATDRLLPIARLASETARARYVGESGNAASFFDARNAEFEIRLLIATARSAREIRLAELEALAGIDLETITSPVLSAEF